MTFVAAVPPNAIVAQPGVVEKPVPVMVTTVPPFAGPVAGERPVTVTAGATYGLRVSGACIVSCIRNQVPVAIVHDVTLPAGPGNVANGSIDNGSNDPDGDPLTMTASPAGPYPLGTTALMLTVMDDKGTLVARSRKSARDWYTRAAASEEGRVRRVAERWLKQDADRPTSRARAGAARTATKKAG